MAEQLTTVIGARKALGELLARYRFSAGHGQHGFVEVLSAEDVYLSRTRSPARSSSSYWSRSAGAGTTATPIYTSTRSAPTSTGA